jgi:cell shape-determining protein MreC
MKLRVRGPSKSVVFAVLMVAAAVASLLPASWTSWARGMVQILGLPQRALSSAARGVREVVLEPGGPALSRAEAERLQEENAELHRLLAAQQAWLEGLERRYDEVCGIRRQLGDVGTALLVAPALGYDSSPVRDTLLIGKGGGCVAGD